jgi:catechol 2,3-dioxygenase-like lactoylglutathione lyase family enzyme
MTLHRFSDGGWLDHIAWAVPDTEAAVEVLRARTGAEIVGPTEPEAGQWYLSAGLPLQEGRFLEVIGPAPGVTGHPFGEILRSLPEPRLLFWYVRAVDWDEVDYRVRALGWPLNRIEEVDDPRFHAYRRAGFGERLDPVVPNIIEWRRRRPGSEDDGDCTLTDFRLGHPDPAPISRLLQAIDCDMEVDTAPRPSLSLELDTPNGPMRLEGVGNPIDGT